MARKYLVNLDMNKNQILNLVLQNLTTHPVSPAVGQVYYNTVDNKVYHWNGTSWLEFGSGSSNLSADNVTLEIVGDTIRIKDSGVTTTKINDGAVTTIKIADQNITFQKIQDIATMTVIGRVSGGTGSASAIPILTNISSGADNTNLATAGSIKSYIDNAIAALGNLEGGWDANTNNNFPTGTGGTNKGDYWYITVAGTIQGISLDVGDVIVAIVNNASTTSATDWIVLETNRGQATTTVLGVVRLATDAETQTGSDTNKVVTPASLSSRTATETRTGLAELATQAETDAGTDDARIVTPLKLKTYLDTIVGNYSTTVGNGSATSFALTHGLNTKDVAVVIYEVANDKEVVADVTTTSTSQVTVAFAVAPTSNQFRVVIKK